MTSLCQDLFCGQMERKKMFQRVPHLKTGHSWHILYNQSSRPAVYVLSDVEKTTGRPDCHIRGWLDERGKKSWRELEMLMKLVSLLNLKQNTVPHIVLTQKSLTLHPDDFIIGHRRNC